MEKGGGDFFKPTLLWIEKQITHIKLTQMTIQGTVVARIGVCI